MRKRAVTSPPDAPIRVLAALSEAAEQGAPCPTNEELGVSLGIVCSCVPHVVARLQKAGRIVIERGGNRRRITIVATGKQTAMSPQVGTFNGSALGVDREIDYAGSDRRFSAAMERVSGWFEDKVVAPPGVLRRLVPLHHSPTRCAFAHLAGAE